MADYTDTQLQNLVFNVLTKDQYNNITTKEADQFYLITDDDSSLKANVSDLKTYCRVTLQAFPSSFGDGVLYQQIHTGQSIETVLVDGVSQGLFFKSGITNSTDGDFGSGSDAPSDDNKIENNFFIQQGRKLSLHFNNAKSYKVFSYTGGGTAVDADLRNSLSSAPIVESTKTDCSFIVNTDVIVCILLEVTT